MKFSDQKRRALHHIVFKLPESNNKTVQKESNNQKFYNTPWMDRVTLAAVETKQKLWKEYKYCRNPHSKEI